MEQLISWTRTESKLWRKFSLCEVFLGNRAWLLVPGRSKLCFRASLLAYPSHGWVVFNVFFVVHSLVSWAHIRCSASAAVFNARISVPHFIHPLVHPTITQSWCAWHWLFQMRCGCEVILANRICSPKAVLLSVAHFPHLSLSKL